jgi:hypothetical protein
MHCSARRDRELEIRGCNTGLSPPCLRTKRLEAVTAAVIVA